MLAFLSQEVVLRVSVQESNSIVDFTTRRFKAHLSIISRLKIILMTVLLNVLSSGLPDS